MELANLLLFGLGIVAVGMLVLGAVVAEYRKSLRGSSLLMIGTGLGMGVLAFSAKLLLIVLYLQFGDSYLAAYLSNHRKVAVYEEPLGSGSMTEQATYQRGYVWQPLPERPPVPHDNPMSPAKVALGKALFGDVRLSADNRVSCASCHDIRHKGGADGLPVSEGIAGQRGSRNAPTVLNAAFQSVLFWDGRAESLEAQAKGPLVNPLEMGMPDHRAVELKLRAIPAYRRDFATVFGGGEPITIDNIARAIAAYERTLVTPDTPYDRFLRGERVAMTAQQLRGMGLFAEFGCINCHRGPNFSDAALVGGASPYRLFPSLSGTPYETRYRLSEDKGLAEGDGRQLRGVWRVPSLRNVTRTAPYFHNGSVTDLKEAIRIMARVQLGKTVSDNASDDWRIEWTAAKRHTAVQTNAAISEREVDDIAAFLRALEGAPAGSAVSMAANRMN